MRPLRFVVNGSSGGRKGRQVQRELCRLFGADRVTGFALPRLPGVLEASRAEQGAVVACGGDGTVAALLDVQARVAPEVPVAVLPLGTGNDLARTMGWKGLTIATLGRLESAVHRRIDRWSVAGPIERHWFSYLSVGCDARIAQRFHALRYENPLADAHPGDEPGALWGDGPVRASTPPGSRPGAGQRPSGARSRLGRSHGPAPAFPAMPVGAAWDRASGARMACSTATPCAAAWGSALTLAGARPAHALGQLAHAELTLRQAMVAQIDGEPMLAPAGVYRISSAGQGLVLAPAA